MKAGADAEAGRSNGRWIEAVVDKNGSQPGRRQEPYGSTLREVLTARSAAQLK
jgi:hypothetical protein